MPKCTNKKLDFGRLGRRVIIASARTAPAPRELVLDVDATHVPLHGEQERGFFHGDHENYCYLPLYVFCGQALLACVLRPSDRDPASVVTALLKRLVGALRKVWPKVRIAELALADHCARSLPAPRRPWHRRAGRALSPAC